MCLGEFLQDFYADIGEFSLCVCAIEHPSAVRRFSDPPINVWWRNERLCEFDSQAGNVFVDQTKLNRRGGGIGDEY